MRKIINVVLFFLLLITVSLNAQSNIETFANGFTIKLNFEEPFHNDNTTELVLIRDYPDFTDVSKSGYFKLPSKTFLIAIPKLTKPIIKMVNVHSEIISNTIPEVQPRSKKINDSTIVYEKVKFEEAIVDDTHNDVELLGYTWYREFYCAIVKINTHKFDYNTRQIIRINNCDLKVEFDPNYPLDFNTITKEPFADNLKLSNSLIINSEIANNFAAKQPLNLPDTTGNWINYNSNYLKLGIAKDGIVRITKEELDLLNIPTSSIDPRTFKLFSLGNEVKIFVKGENDGSFDDNDFIEFWGHRNYPKISYRVINQDNEEYNEFLNRYTDTSYYFLTWGQNNGLHIDSSNFNSSSITDTLLYHSQFLHFETNTYFDFPDQDDIARQTPSWNKNKTWYIHTLTTSRTYNISLNNVYPGKTAKIFAKTVGWASNYPSNSHQVKLLFNNTFIDSNSINRFKQLILSGQINSSSLTNGTNQLKLENIPNGSSPNGLLVDWYEIEYPRYLNMINDSLYFKVPQDINSGLKVFKVGNANQTTYRIYKVKPDFQIISNYSLSASNLFFADSVSAGDEYYIISDERKIVPKYYYLKPFLNLRNITAQIDYISITHPKFLTSVQNYVQSISDLYDISASMFNVEDIFDEFSFGYPYPEGIRLFLNVLYNNTQDPKPEYLTLIGDANYDYKSFLGISGGKNYVPSFGNPVGDNWYAIWDLEALPIPQLKVGRIPINKSEELDYYLTKVQNNFNQKYDEWNKHYLFFSGGRANEPGEIAQLKAANDQVINNYVKPAPLAGSYTHFFKTSDPITDFGPYTPEQISKAIDNGGVFISYIGHSGTATWDNSISETTQLKNKVNRNPLITDFGCSTNKFAEPDIVSFGERFLINQDGQAIGYIGNSSLGFTSTSLTLPIYFYGEIINSSDKEVGAGHLSSKIKMFNNLGSSPVFKLFSLTNTLLGDPIIKIRIPNKPNLNISESDIIYDNNFINDAMDSVQLKIIINNYGIKDTSTFSFDLIHSYKDTLRKSYTDRRSLPSFKDTLSVWINVKNLAGENTIIINLDADNEIDELYEDDNNIEFHFYVYSTELRDIVKHRIENPALNNIKILNPSINNNTFHIRYQISEYDNFQNPIENIIPADSFFTSINLSGLQNNKRYYFRYRLDESNSVFSNIKSFVNKPGSDFLLTDSVSLSDQTLNDLEYQNQNLSIVPEDINISVTSAGFEAGATCIIAKNGINLLSNTYFAGMGIVVFDDITFDVDTSTWYNLFNNPTNMAALVELIDSIPDGKIVAMGVSDDAANNITTALKDAIKTLGSTKIDQISFRGSWALIGKKGAVPGEVVEEVKGRYDGLIYIDSTFVIPKKEGTFETIEIGPATNWQTASINQTIPNGSEIQHTVYGIKSDTQIDSLAVLNLINNNASLSFINPDVYPKIKIKSFFKTNPEGMSPELSSLGVDYVGLSEIGTNYQVVGIDKDTIMVGENVRLTFWIYNAGEANSDSFNVKVDVLNSDNTLDTSYSFNSVSIAAGDRKKFDVDYIPFGSDTERKFVINIDPENKVKEYFKDNNFFTKSVYVQKDLVSPTVKITFDETEIINGDFVSNKPEIKIALSDDSPIPITDTTAIKIYLNEMPVYYGVTKNNISYSTSPDNPKFTIDYKPELEDGDYLLRVVGKDLSGNIADSATSEVYFVVSSETKLHQVYNYPNPFSDETYFTFRLSQIPQEIKIRIYTIAGRMIKEIVRSASELNFDLNRIYWDGKDEDGDIIANGTYIYKVFIKNNDKVESVTQKLVIVK